MEQERFDLLARRLGRGTTRRGAVAAVVAVGLGGWAGGDAGAKKKKKCSAKKPCPECQVCTKGKCLPGHNGDNCGNRGACFDGACICDTGMFECGRTKPIRCCQNGQTCDNGACGTCPSGGTLSVPAAFCGIWDSSDPTNAVCGCVTSVEGTTACTNGLVRGCQNCATDAECADRFGAPAICVRTDGEQCGNGVTTGCVAAECAPPQE